MSLKRTSSAAGLPDRADDAPCCWLCLEEGSNDSGEPLIRDCSCRGTSGFAHLSCAVKYAESKTKEAYEKNNFLDRHFFRNCPNCNQGYLGEVKYAFAKAQVEFVEREYKNDLEVNLQVMVYKLRALVKLREEEIMKEDQYRQEGGNICSNMLSIIEQTKQNPSLEQDQDMKFTIAAANNNIGEFFEKFNSNEYLERAKKHFMQARDLFEQVEDNEDKDVFLMAVARNFRIVEAKLTGTEPELDTAGEVAYRREMYNFFKSLEEFGLSTIRYGIELALALHNAHHSIESERFLTKLMQICRRVHGQDHRSTEKTLTALERVRTRRINMGADICYQALRYENDGESIVVKGPMIDEEKRDEETRDEEKKVLTVESKDVTPRRGTPVVVHSLPEESMSHLNGKIGDIRGYSEDNRTCEIHFEEEGLDPAFVKLENLRILFDLPEKEETEESK